jgi:heme-degrading monooxygenase HmoA
MVFVMSLYKVRTADIPVFSSAFNPTGIWPRVANTLPGYVHADLMVRSGSPTVFLLLQFWETAESFQMAQRSEAFQNLIGFLATIATGYLDLGIFGFRSAITRTGMAGQANSARW